MMKRVMCLYRVSTKGQVDNKDDIPMQRRECQSFIERQEDWVFAGEVMEKGVSGYKVSAAKRDAIIELREMAEKKQFDVLLVFMFDRLGRKEDETPFLVKWFIDHGVEVWSTREGEQRLDNQVDRLLNFMRYWAASGESEKTSIRVKAAQRQMVQDGIWRGGHVPYGYKLEHRGRIGKKNKEMNDLVVDETAVPVVLEIFDLLTREGYGTLKIANYLNKKYPDPKKIWTRQTLLAMIKNPVYIGRLHMNDFLTEPKEELRIISDEQFEFANEILKRRVITRHPVNQEGRSILSLEHRAVMLSGILYCAHCGHRLVGSWSTKRNKNGTVYRYPNYRCYTNSIKAKKCTGMTAYRAHIIEEVVLADVRQYFASINSAVDAEWRLQARQRMRNSCTARLEAAEAKLTKLQSDQVKLKDEIMKSIRGESSFSTDVLKEMMDDIKRAQDEARTVIQSCQDDAANEEKRINELNNRYKDIRDWSKQFDLLPPETKKMILARMIEKITVDRDYNIEIHYYITQEDFYGSENVDVVKTSGKVV